jgi:hypothetical protein
MHPYVTNSDEKRKVPLLLAILSILAAWGLFKIVKAFHITPPWWFEMPSLIGFYGLFYTVFDRSLWRAPIIRKIGLVKVPDLDGKWEGEIASSFDGHQNRRDVSILVRQTWTSIRIDLETANSKSSSQTAAIIIETPDSAIISYEYINEPKAHSTMTMHTHRGTARHTWCRTGDSETLNGEYYTGRDRGTFGVLYLNKE